MEVGIRELRADLSRWIKRVREGDEVLVTDRGKPVARIVPMNGERKIDKLIAAGLISARPKPSSGSPRPVKADGPISDLVSEQRR